MLDTVGSVVIGGSLIAGGEGRNLWNVGRRLIFIVAGNSNASYKFCCWCSKHY